MNSVKRRNHDNQLTSLSRRVKGRCISVWIFALNWKSLKIRPNFPEAREYLAEAYLQGIVKQITLLKTYGDKGKDQLAILTVAFQEVGKQFNDSK